MKSEDVIFWCFIIIFLMNFWQIQNIQRRLDIQSQSIYELKLIVENLDDTDKNIIKALQVLD